MSQIPSKSDSTLGHRPVRATSASKPHPPGISPSLLKISANSTSSSFVSTGHCTGTRPKPLTGPTTKPLVPGNQVSILLQASKQASALRSYATSTLLGKQPTDPSLIGLLKTLSNSHAESTKSGFRTALKHASAHLGLTPLTLVSDHPDLITSQATLALQKKLEDKEILPATANRYSLSIKSIISRTPGVPSQDFSILKDFSRSMIRQGCNVPTWVTLPLRRHHVNQLLKQYPKVDEQAATYLAWKTVSRWDEIPNLCLPLDHFPDKGHLLVNWLDGTKIGGKKPFLPRLLTVIEYSSGLPIPPQVLKYLTTHKGPVCPRLTTAKMQERLRQIPVHLKDIVDIQLVKGQRLRTHYTGHSFKKGGNDFLWEMWHQGHLSKPEIIQRLSKHSPPEADVVGECAVRYASRRYLVALALETHLATRLL